MAYQRMGDNVNWTHTTKYYRNAPLPNRITISKPMVLEPAWVQFCIGTRDWYIAVCVHGFYWKYRTHLSNRTNVHFTPISDSKVDLRWIHIKMQLFIHNGRGTTTGPAQHGKPYRAQQLHKYSMDKTWDYTVLCSGNLRWDFELRQKTPSRPNLRCKGVARSVIRKSFGQTLQITVNLYLEMQSSHVMTRSNITR